MYYEEGMSWDDYQDVGFIPLYEPYYPTDEARQEAWEACNVSSEAEAQETTKKRCLFDTTMTGRADIGANTAAQGTTIKQQNAVLSKSDNCTQLTPLIYNLSNVILVNEKLISFHQYMRYTHRCCTSVQKPGAIL